MSITHAAPEIVDGFRRWAAEQGWHIPTPICDSRIHRFNVRERNIIKRNRGWYRVHVTPHQAWAVVGDWARDGYLRWSWHDNATTPIERREAKRLMAEATRAAAEAARRAQQETAEIAARRWAELPAAPVDHPYLLAKGIGPHNARADGKLLVIPVYSQGGAVVSLQTIDPDGKKRFLPGGRTKECLTRVGATLGRGRLIVVTEGFATAGSIAEAVPDACVLIAFSAYNLVPIAHFARAKRPGAAIVIAADNDLETDGNPGVAYATRAAESIQGRVAVPTLPTGRKCDFNDVAKALGPSAVRESIAPAGDPAPQPATTPPPAPDWRDRLDYDDKGKLVRKSLRNLTLFVEYHEAFAGQLRFNAMSGETEVANVPGRNDAPDWRPMRDTDVFLAREWFARHGLSPSSDDTRLAMAAIGERNPHSPVADWLKSRDWDGIERVDHWLSETFGIEPDAYGTAVARCFLVGAVARALRPGCKHDHVLVLEGEQGIGKSTALATLFGQQWVTEGHDVFDDQAKLVEAMQNAWCVELTELTALRGNRRDLIKGLITTRVDRLRLAYGRSTEARPRHCVFAATTNDRTYLDDDTGNRRYWPIACETVDLDWLADNRDQLWAEAVRLFRAGTPWHLTDPHALAMAREAQSARFEVDPWEAVLQRHPDVRNPDGISMTDALNACGVPVERHDRRAARRVGAILRRMGLRYVRARECGGDFTRVWRRE